MTRRLLSYFFLLAAVLSILDGAFVLNPDMQVIKQALLILSGIVVGVLITEHQEEIMKGSFVALVGGLFLQQVVGFTQSTIATLATMLYTFLTFIAALALTLGLVYVLEHLSKLFDFETKSTKSTKKESTEYAWSITILVAVALTFIILLLELFAISPGFARTLIIVDGIITALFIVDLFFLYKHSKGWKDFVKHNFFDILASIPAIGVFRALKIVRAIRIIRAARSSLKFTKISKVQKTTKFFSKKSSFNDVNKKKKKATKKR